MTVVGVADQYMIMLAITILFTILSLAYLDSKLLSLLAGISWLVASIGHFSVGSQTSSLTMSLSFLYLGLGIIFVVRTVIAATRMMSEDRFKITLD